MIKKLLFVTCTFILAGCEPSKNFETSHAKNEHYQLAVDGEGNAWRLDTSSGEMSRCWQGMAKYAAPTCYKATQLDKPGALGSKENPIKLD